MAEKSNNKPTLEIRSGKIKASVWESDKVLESGQHVVEHSIKIVKSYKDKKSGDWKETDFFFPDELLQLSAISNELFRLLALTVKNIQ
ncbi:MAG: hypothetical protein UV78_C0051G0005 [Parcubacteria group bacterium GW2011_GWA2_43_17]|nr:MAG: hypothetical protein UV78_C0051G0005 [Parcubacteria group bacterium GW2011_GWA2_43_17]HBG78946.1 hypothetical protein [Phycisphaerales bacterium]HBR20473.1 hypothetical protein [Phycisphaerales bacterium]